MGQAGRGESGRMMITLSFNLYTGIGTGSRACVGCTCHGWKIQLPLGASPFAD